MKLETLKREWMTTIYLITWGPIAIEQWWLSSYSLIRRVIHRSANGISYDVKGSHGLLDVEAEIKRFGK